MHFIRNPFAFDPRDFKDTFVQDIGSVQLELLQLKSNDELAEHH